MTLRTRTRRPRAHIAIIASLLTAGCNEQDDFALQLLHEVFTPDLVINDTMTVQGTACIRHRVTVADTALTPDTLARGDLAHAPSLAYATENPADIGLPDAHTTAMAQAIAAARNCFEDPNHFHTLTNETPVWIYTERRGHTILLIPTSNLTSLHIFRG